MNQNLLFSIEESINTIDSLEQDSFERTRHSTIIKSGLFLIFESLVNLSEDAKKDTVRSFEEHPTIYADIVSSIDNPNCSCRGRVIKFIEENPQVFLNIIKNLLEKYPLETSSFEDISNRIEHYISLLKDNNVNTVTEDKSNTEIANPQNSLMGHVITVQSNTDYFNLIKSLNSKNMIYNGISVVNNNGAIDLYFY
jgi:hypothetical protein